ncbi:MAG TPA: hypothetical protein VGN57_01570 [Pirellulaceae bacterium]|jgi:hypothetical protein|nr:hypothetical protein [Pirellulaceae bacterium]
MNSPESITVSLDWSRKLKEAGWPQGADSSLFSWIEGWHGAEWPDGRPFEKDVYYRNFAIDILDSYFHEGTTGVSFAAPTAEEILQRLPQELRRDEFGREWHLSCWPIGSYWRLCYASADMKIEQHHERGESLANAAAAMYCYLAENKLLPTP